MYERSGKSSDGEEIPNLSRNPVESVDHSLIMGEKVNINDLNFCLIKAKKHCHHSMLIVFAFS